MIFGDSVSEDSPLLLYQKNGKGFSTLRYLAMAQMPSYMIIHFHWFQAVEGML